jgi:site-specific DNA recombinase
LNNNIDHPRNVIMREDLLIRPLDTWLVQEFGPRQRRHTIAKLVAQAAVATPPPTPATPPGPTTAECDAKLARYRAALEAGADPAVVAGWIADTQAARRLAEQRHHAAASPKIADPVSRLTEEEIIAIIEGLGDIVSALREAAPEHKLDVYRNLGLSLTYRPETRTVRADIDLAAHRWASVRVRSPT